MLFQIQNGTLSFGDKVVLSHVDMEIRGNEKIGIVGSNGTGKTSLLRLISGELSLDRDDKRQGKGLFASRKLKIATLEQEHSKWLDSTLEEILLEGFYEAEGMKRDTPKDISLDYSAERFYFEQRYRKLLRSFGFSAGDTTKKLRDFSGGEQRKLMLVKMLLSGADILLLDEPTNHLDTESVEELERQLAGYAGAVVAVSHDRYFLDHVAEVIYELDDALLKRYPGNYTAYRKEKRKQYERQQKAYERQQEEIERNEQLIRQFKNKPRKAAFARSRKTMLDRMQRLPKPKEDMGHIFTGDLTPEYPGPKWMLQIKDLQIGYEGGESLVGELSLRIRRGQKIGIIGKNGTGKSTFLKTLIKQIPPLSGSFQFGEKAEVSYFEQDSGQIQSEEKVVDHFKTAFPGMTEKEVYGKLAAFLFQGSICQQKISSLSGGEKARLKLCEMLTMCPNFLILDEPTNHMDIPAKETLESAFRSYKGTMLVVSHDRYFLDQVVDAILVLDERSAYYYPFGYSHYVNRRLRMTELMEKGVSPDDLPGMLSAQDQALVAGLKAVPKSERHESRQLSDDEAYLDWKLHLAEEPMEMKKQKVQQKWEALQRAEEHYQIQRMEHYPQEEETLKHLETEKEMLFREYEAAVAEWTQACLDWYDILNDPIPEKIS